MGYILLCILGTFLMDTLTNAQMHRATVFIKIIEITCNCVLGPMTTHNIHTTDRYYIATYI